LQSIETLALVGVSAHGTLCLLYMLVWRVQRQNWAACFAAAYLMSALLYAFDAQLQPVDGRPNPMAALLSMPALLLSTLGMIDYVGLRGAVARRMRIGFSLGVVGVFGLLALGLMNRLAGFIVLAFYLGAQGALAVRVWLREPRSGHGLVVAALMLYPVVIVAAVLGAFEVALLRYVVILPTAMVGMMVLTTGLLRAHRRAQDELQRRESAERALQLVNESLERRVTQRTEELHDVIAGLESFNRSVSHDLRGPLGGIAGLAHLATRALESGDAVSAARMVEVIGRQADSSAGLVDDLLALARVGDAELAPQPLDLRPFVEETLAGMRQADPQGEDWPVTVGPLPVVEADPGLLRQVFVNLVSNAVKFSREAASPRIEVGAMQRDGEQIVYVRDNGVGFDPAQAERLFQPFQQLHGARYQGHGVGLSIVKRVVERHGGRVWAQSGPEAGSTFFFSLRGR
jgi:signal transduction histidine kinase